MLVNGFSSHDGATFCGACVYIIILLKVSGLVVGSDTASSSKQFQRQPDFAQTTCPDDDTVLYQEAKDITRCLVLCSNTVTCYTVLYDGTHCSGCRDIYDVTGIGVLFPGNAVATTHFQRTSVCGDGWYYLKRSCYRLSSRGTFQEGQIDCAEKEGNAVSVESASENDFLKQQVTALDTDVSAFYLGITDDCNGDGVWRQTGTGDVVPFSDFYLGEPNHPGIECCIAMYRSLNFQWVDFGCQASLPTICEKQPNQ